MKFDDVTVTLLGRGSSTNDPSAVGGRVAGRFRANLDAVRESARNLRHERDAAWDRIAMLEEQLRSARAEGAHALAAVEQDCARELEMARTLLAAGEQHCRSLELRLTQTRRELLRERATTKTLRECLLVRRR